MKIGEPHINCADIPLNPTYTMRKGSEVGTPLEKLWLGVLAR
jgi:hypothetical protein